MSRPTEPTDDAEVSMDDLEIMEEIEDTHALAELGTTLIQAILEKEPLANIEELIDADAALWFQDNEGTSPLHAAAYVGNKELVDKFLNEGAIWNAVDNLGNTAGDIALSLNDEACYNLIRDAGIRAELLFAVLASRLPPPQLSPTLITGCRDTTAAGNTDMFLGSNLKYTKDAHGQGICLLELDNGESIGVMMGWEEEIMRKTVDALCTDHPRVKEGLRILNVGFGLGIIDGLFQGLTTPPSLHVIIEAHRDVLAYMKECGWDKKPGAKIMQGKWQDVVQSEEFRALGKFDVVYTDTFAEDYGELHKFFKLLPDLLIGPQARFSFFNGLGATNALFYDVYSRVSECHLSDIGADVRWSSVEVNDEEDPERWGESRRYFTQPVYRLPLAQLRQRS